MKLDWFDAHEAVAIGATLADGFTPKFTLSADGDSASSRPAAARAARLLRQAAGQIRPLKLNFFKRTKLLASFKWRLAEHGFDGATIDDLIRSLLLQVTTGVASGVVVIPRDAESAHVSDAKLLQRLLAEARARFTEGDSHTAVARLKDALTIDSRRAVAHAMLGAALLNLGRYGEAEAELRRALELKAAYPGAHLNLGELLRLKGEFAASETALRRAVKQEPGNPDALTALGLTLVSRSQLDRAKDAFGRALRLKPHHADAFCGFAWLACIEGRFEEAEALYRRALETDPRLPQALAGLAELRHMTAADTEWLTAVNEALAAGMPASQESRLRFALGKYFDDLQSYSRAFEQYRRANELSRSLGGPYDRAARTALIDNMVHIYSREVLTRQAEGASDSARPAFVTGMPRSGTTLVAQIIASHPRAVVAGELAFWNDAALRHYEILQREPPDGSLGRKLVDAYLRQLGLYAPDALRVVDKSNFNIDHLGLIHSLFPRARVIHLRRDPIDTCLSCYFQNFANAAPFTMDLSDVAHYCREQHRLAEHWRATLPSQAFLEVRYEDLVADQETWSRRIIEFLGLEWDPRCLEFHKTERAVLTASTWQVRQRIYSRSVGRWKNYEKFIGPLLELRDLAS